MSVNILEEANRCFQCKKPMCQMACPVSTPIPEIIDLFKKRKLMTAGEKLFTNNPMSVICSIVCDHAAQCAGHCIRAKKDTPVQFFEIETYISDAYLDRMRVNPPVKNGKRVAVIGSGPAGLTVAILLAARGYDVTIFERQHRIGGMLQYGIPEFRLPKSFLSRYESKLREMGISIRPNTTIGGALHIDDLLRDGYVSVFIGTGTWRARSLGLEGESLPNVHYGVSYLASPAAYRLGETVAIIGTGNVAMDVARTAFRHGARRVMMFARSKKVAASDHETMFAELDGAELIHGHAIAKITPEGPVFRKAIFGDDDKVVGYEEEPVLVRADATIIATGQVAKDKLTRTTDGLRANDKGLLIVDDRCQTTLPGVFAAGDVVHGSLTAVHAVQKAKIAAKAMIDYMESLP